MRRTFPLLIASCFVALVVVVGWGSSVGAWSTGDGGDPNWGSTPFGGTSSDHGYGVAVDSSGNVYVTGNFAGTVNFGAGDVTSAGGYDAFVTKFDSSGAHQWTTTLGGTGADSGWSVAVDGSSNVHVTGNFAGTVNFGAGNVTSAGSNDVFVTKLNSSGAHQWTTTLGGTGGQVGKGVAVDSSGNVHVTGEFNGTVNFGAGDVTYAGGYDAFVTKFDSSGA
ncbi:MAG: SBBP repeat-containing protein, partial [Acidimicrobiales bacterium]|nr:SBBP repeat-containing protein [Acidimicrobiales bacterium]